MKNAFLNIDIVIFSENSIYVSSLNPKPLGYWTKSHIGRLEAMLYVRNYGKPKYR